MTHDHVAVSTGMAPIATLLILGLAVLVAAGLGACAVARRLGWRPLTGLLLALIGFGAVVFQVLHFSEHTFQLGHWAADRAAAPWMSPFARAAADGFAGLAGRPGNHAVGMELLHLAGNWIFLGGLLALRGCFAHRFLTVAFWLQLLHVVEHAALTGTVLITGRAIGSSTLFGLAAELPGAWGPSMRVWWHFLMNLAVTVAACLAIAAWRRHSSRPAPIRLPKEGSEDPDVHRAVIAGSR